MNPSQPNGSCKNCNKLILQPGVTYGINPNAVCHCTNPSPQSNDTTELDDLDKLIKDEIRYRVEQEYAKYHNQLTFDQNGLDFWVDQIVEKLSDTITPAIQAIIDTKVAEATSNWSIMGKTPDEVYTIFRALEFERIADIEVAMKNLDAIAKMIQDDLRDANQRAINKAFKRYTHPTTEEKHS